MEMGCGGIVPRCSERWRLAGGEIIASGSIFDYNNILCHTTAIAVVQYGWIPGILIAYTHLTSIVMSMELSK